MSRVDLAALRAELDAPHVIDLRPDGWTIRHPLSCRPDLFACPVNQAGREPPAEEPGLYECEFDGDGVFLIGRPVTDDREPVDLRALADELEAARGFHAAFHTWWDGKEGSLSAVLDAKRAYERAAGQ